MDSQSCSFVGRLARLPKFHEAGIRGQEHASFTLAINRVVPSRDAGPKADFIPCSVWGPEAIQLIQTAGVGDELRIKGRFRTNFVERGDGTSSFFIELRVHWLRYGAVSRQNLAPQPVQDAITAAVGGLSKEFA